MRNLLVMTLSGSCMLLFYLLLKYGTKGRISGKTLYWLYKASVIFYLLPLWYLKPVYKEIYDFLFADMEILQYAQDVSYTYQGGKLFIDGGTSFFMNDFLKWQTAIGVSWALGGVAIMLVEVGKHVKERKRVQRNKWETPDEEAQKLAATWVEKYKIKRKIVFYTRDAECKTFTMGIFHPVVFYSSKEDTEAKEMLLQHEIFHIKRYDMLWKLLGQLVLCIHWYNPLTWIMLREWHRVCEESCDSEVVKERDWGIRSKYMEMIIRDSVKAGDDLAYNIGLSKNAENVKRRVDNIMKTQMIKAKTWKKAVSVLGVGMAVLLNSLTVYAYDDIQFRSVDPRSENYAEEVDLLLNGDGVFVEEDCTEHLDGLFGDIHKMREIDILYDEQFVDEGGNIYPAGEDGYETCAICDVHTFVDGTYTFHQKQDDGSCIVKYYDARRCTVCGYVDIMDLISTTHYVVCTH
ncbi:MAG: M56 family metallopeptidase [Lachnospiraceae bacterium]|nr:M56 family metallopeptidase [Lachnospiraceae bacterium]